MIESDRLTKRFGAFTAVDDLSFTVEPGEVLGFLGPNGAGKSTTMKMLTGFLAPSAGTARINGFDIQRQPLQAKREFGYLPEGAPGYGDMTVLAFLKFMAEIRGLTGSEAQKAVDQAIEQVELEAVLLRPIDNLSKGYKRRVGLAQSLLHDPKVLIMDEPTDGLDPNQKHQVRELIQRMSADKLLIISTHILEEVEAVCSRAMIIANGKLLADGTPAELAARSKYHQAVGLTVDNPQAAADLLKVLPQAEEVLLNEKTGEITVLPVKGADLFSAIRQTAEQQNWQLGQLYQQQGRLDDVFRAITRSPSNSLGNKEAA